MSGLVFAGRGIRRKLLLCLSPRQLALRVEAAAVFIDYLDRGAAVNPNGLCVVDAAGACPVTHAEAVALSHRIGAALAARGLTKGSKVAVYSPNAASALLCVLGTFRIGATWIALNPKSTPAELADLLNLVGCEFLLYHADVAASAKQLMTAVPTIKDALRFGAGSITDEGWLGAPASRIDWVPVAATDPVMIMGTGGTTGRPKAVPITKQQYLAMCLAFNAHMSEPAPPVYLLATPMTHAAGVSAWPVIAEGGTIVVHDGVKPQEIFDSIEARGVTRLFLPPTAIYTLLAHPSVRETDFGSLRHFIYAAAPISAEKLIEAMDVFGPVMTQTFGQVEAPMICTCMTPQDHVEALADPSKRQRLESCGRPSLVTAVAILDDRGQPLGPNERGEIAVRGELTMLGYYDPAEGQSEIVRPDGWHRTGDVGYRDEDGFIYIVDRKRELIITGGFNVYPAEIERVILAQPAVLDCAVVGAPDAKWGEAVTAVVELKAEARLTADEVIAECRAQLGPVKTPKRVVFASVPRSSNGKVLRRVVREQFWAGRERRV